MKAPMLVRFYHPEHCERVGLLRSETVSDISAAVDSVAAWLKASVGSVEEAIADLQRAADEASDNYPLSFFDHAPALDQPYLLPPVDVQDVWASGVTYERSRAARQEEAVDGGDIYARVYVAERPELFFKAHGSKVVGPFGEVGIRRDSAWNVPEPELTLALNPAMEVVGMTVGNDMSSRDIEGENPLYLPQAKVYTASCALGPGIVLGTLHEWPETTIHITVMRAGERIVDDSVHTRTIRRSLRELVEYLGRSNTFSDGVLLMTGTGVIPPTDFSLQAGDRVTITIGAIGTLTNTVKVV